MLLNIHPFRIETCANMREQMQIFNFSLKADYTCKLVNTQNSIRYMHITEIRSLHLWRVGSRMKSRNWYNFLKLILFLFLILFCEVRKEVYKFQQFTFLYISRTDSSGFLFIHSLVIELIMRNNW